MSNDLQCPKCGQTVPERATAEYVVGLLTAPMTLLLIAVALHYSGLLPRRLYYVSLGVLVSGTYMLVRTDEHIKRWWLTSRYASGGGGDE